MSAPIASHRKIDLLLEEYGSSHKNTLNKTIHWICVPIIFFSIFGLVRSIPTPEIFDKIPYLSWASILLLLALGYYLTLSFPLTIGFILFGTLVVIGNEYLFSAGRFYLLICSIVFFVLAWTGQFIGHGVEGKKPSFLKDLQFLMIGPAWLMHFIYKKIGIRY
jgi:uncharacterized membrane protein YGL010W